jgi:O-antigen/teichoic acid export membrane protein
VSVEGTAQTSTAEAPQSLRLTSRSRVRNAGYLVGSQLISSACIFVTGILLARTLGPAGRGYYDVVAATGTLLAILFGLSLGSGTLFYASRGAIDSRRTTRLALWAAAIPGALGAGLLLVAGERPIVAWMVPGVPSVTTVLLIGLVAALSQAQLLLRGIIVGGGHFATFALSEVLGRGLFLTAVVALVLAGAASPPTYVWAFTISAAVAVGLLAWQGSRLQSGCSTVPLRGIVTYSLPLYVGNLIQFLNYRVDVFFLNSYLSVASVGLYTVAVSLAQVLWLVPNALATVVMREVAEVTDGRVPLARTAEVNRFCLWTSALGGLVVFAVAAATVRTVLGAEFVASLHPLGVLLPGVVLFCPTIILSAYLNGIQKQMYTTWVAGAALVVTIVLNVILIPVIGISGAALASTASYSLSSIVTLGIVRRSDPSVSWTQLLGLQRADLVKGITLLRSASSPRVARWL